jgi:hypothetical protein
MGGRPRRAQYRELQSERAGFWPPSRQYPQLRSPWPRLQPLLPAQRVGSATEPAMAAIPRAVAAVRASAQRPPASAVAIAGIATVTAANRPQQRPIPSIPPPVAAGRAAATPPRSRHLPRSRPLPRRRHLRRTRYLPAAEQAPPTAQGHRRCNAGHSARVGRLRPPPLQCRSFRPRWPVAEPARARAAAAADRTRRASASR